MRRCASTTSARRADCWEDGHGRGKLFSGANFLVGLVRRNSRSPALVDEGADVKVHVGFRE